MAKIEYYEYRIVDAENGEVKDIKLASQDLWNLVSQIKHDLDPYGDWGNID